MVHHVPGKGTFAVLVANERCKSFPLIVQVHGGMELDSFGFRHGFGFSWFQGRTSVGFFVFDGTSMRAKMWHNVKLLCSYTFLHQSTPSRDDMIALLPERKGPSCTNLDVAGLRKNSKRRSQIRYPSTVSFPRPRSQEFGPLTGPVPHKATSLRIALDIAGLQETCKQQRGKFGDPKRR